DPGPRLGRQTVTTLRKRILIALAPLTLAGSVWGGVAYAQSHRPMICWMGSIIEPGNHHSPAAICSHEECVVAIPGGGYQPEPIGVRAPGDICHQYQPD